jgi:hypothetical protein
MAPDVPKRNLLELTSPLARELAEYILCGPIYTTAWRRSLLGCWRRSLRRCAFILVILGSRWSTFVGR